MRLLWARFELVAAETVSAYKEMMIDEGWDQKSDFVIKGFNRIPVKVGRLGFSRVIA